MYDIITWEEVALWNLKVMCFCVWKVSINFIKVIHKVWGDEDFDLCCP